MIIDSKENQDIFEGDENIIVFAINTEGINDSGFAGIVARKGWPELANMGECELGSVYTKEIDGKKYCGIVCHSLSKIDGWGTSEEQTKIIKECFDKIEVAEGEKIGSIAIGNGLIGKMSGADYEAIALGMSKSNKDVVLYGRIPEKVLEAQEESKVSVNNIEIPEYIKRISEIKKDELTERGFYEKILEQIAVSDTVTPETAKILKETLIKIGFKKYSEWEAEKIANGEEVESGTIGEGIEKGTIATAVSMVSQFLNDYESASYGQSKMLDGGEEFGWVQTWLRNSKAIEEDRNIDEEAKEKAEAMAKIPGWIEKGKVLTYPERLEEWEKCVKTRAEDLYNGWDLENAIEIMEKLQSGATLEEAIEIFDNAGHSGASAGMVRSIVFAFSKRGPEFYEGTAFGELSEEAKKAVEEKKRENIEFEKASAIKVFVNPKYGSDLDAAIKTLEEHKNKGESVVIEFNGRKLYSCDFTVDSVYKDVTGYIKSEFEEEVKKSHEEYKERKAQEKAEARAKMPGWIEKGKELTYPERMEEWEKCVKTRAEDLYNGWDLENAIEIMEKLESGATLEEAIEIFDNAGHSGASAGMVRSIVFTFSKRGPEFYEGTAFGELSEEDKKAIEDRKLENAELDKKEKSDKGKETGETTENADKGLTRKKLESLTEEEILALDKELDESLENANKKLEEEKRKSKLISSVLAKAENLEKINEEIKRVKSERNKKTNDTNDSNDEVGF